MAPTPADGGAPDVEALFERYQERHRRSVCLRLVGIFDSSAVSERVHKEVVRRGGELDGPNRPDPFLWLRQVTGEVLARLHRERFGPAARGDISLYGGALPEATSISLAAHLLGKASGEDDRAAARAEQKLLLQEALNAMDPLDREVLTLRHCEQLSNDETATVLGIPKAQASDSYIRALKRVTRILAALPGFKAKG